MAPRIVLNNGEGAPTSPVIIGCQCPTERGLALGKQAPFAKGKSGRAQRKQSMAPQTGEAQSQQGI